jgi:hypothetical protein
MKNTLYYYLNVALIPILFVMILVQHLMWAGKMTWRDIVEQYHENKRYFKR